MILTSIQTFVIIIMLTIATMITRFLPFILFKNTKSDNSYISYLGEVLPFAAIGLLLVYCLKDISFKNQSLWMPEVVAVVITALVHYFKESTLISISIGTVVYMVLVQLVFI